MRIVFALLVALIAVAGCGGCADDAYTDYLLGLPTHARARNDVAIDVVSGVYGIDSDGIHVMWVTTGGGIRAYADAPGLANGVTLTDDPAQCLSWVYWKHAVGAHPTDDPVETNTDFHSTAMAHEVAHCALARLTGDPDRHHTNRGVWGWCSDSHVDAGADLRSACSRPGLHEGLVHIAQDALAADGL